MRAPIDLNPDRSLGTLVAEQPGRAQVFEQLDLDYCCEGRQSLTEACAKRGLDLDWVRATLQAVDTAGRTEDVEDTDWMATGLGELCDHIVAVHHDGLREAFPRIGGLVETVVRIHADRDPRLRDVQRVFNEVRADLEPHLASEEDELFPACIAWEQHGQPVEERLIAEHEQEHASVGRRLSTLRELCGDYDPAAAHCTTHRRLLVELEAFEQDMHRHVHEENNILFRRVRKAPEPEAGALPPCCEGWIAEQAHKWARPG